MGPLSRMNVRTSRVNVEMKLQPWERYVFGFDTGADGTCMVSCVYNTRTGVLRILAVEYAR